LQGDAILNVAPKKANWDLRRDVAKKLEKLERRTQRALVQLMQQQQHAQLAREGQAD
jgi:coiled-coil domain-containing protein 12